MHSISLPRTCLGCTNFVFFTFGLLGGFVCIWCAINTEFFKAVNFTVTKSPHVSSIADLVNLRVFSTPLTAFLIPIVAITTLTSCCGIFGAGCKWKCALKSYIFLVSVISSIAFWVFFISGVYNIYTNNEKTKGYLQNSIKQFYGRENDLISSVWNYVMVNYECCGVIGYWDFAESNWRKANPKLLYPVQCCVLSNVTALIPVSENCTKTLDRSTKFHIEVSCMHTLRESIIKNKGMLIFYIVLIAIAYAFLAFFTFCLIRGEPLVGRVTDTFNYMPSAPELKTITPSRTSLENMMFVNEPPQKVVRVVSAANPFQSYKFTPDTLDSRGQTFSPNHWS